MASSLKLAGRIRTDVFLRPKYVQSSTSLVFISAQAIALGLSSFTFLFTGLTALAEQLSIDYEMKL